MLSDCSRIPMRSPWVEHLGRNPAPKQLKPPGPEVGVQGREGFSLRPLRGACPGPGACAYAPPRAVRDVAHAPELPDAIGARRLAAGLPRHRRPPAQLMVRRDGRGTCPPLRSAR